MTTKQKHALIKAAHKRAKKRHAKKLQAMVLAALAGKAA
jgi:hypothetical protein